MKKNGTPQRRIVGPDGAPAQPVGLVGPDGTPLAGQTIVQTATQIQMTHTKEGIIIVFSEHTDKLILAPDLAKKIGTEILRRCDLIERDRIIAEWTEKMTGTSVSRSASKYPLPSFTEILTRVQEAKRIYAGSVTYWWAIDETPYVDKTNLPRDPAGAPLFLIENPVEWINAVLANLGQKDQCPSEEVLVSALHGVLINEDGSQFCSDDWNQYSVILAQLQKEATA